MAEINKKKRNVETIKNGLYSFFIMVIIIAAAVVVNLLVARLELTADLTEDKLYTITDDTLDLLKKVDDKITIYYLSSAENKNDQMYELVEKYQKHGKNIKVEFKDTDVYPQFANKYNPDLAEESFEENSIVVINEDNPDRFKYITYSDMYIVDYSAMYYGGEANASIDIEGQITSAINFITTDETYKMYFVTGHNEATEFGSITSDLFSKMNFEFDTITIGTEEKIPEDCTLLVMSTPTVDITEEELTKLKAYIDEGRPLLMLTSAMVAASNMPNYSSLLSYYCMLQLDGVVAEMNSNNAYQSATVLLPNFGTHEIVEGMSVYAFMPNAAALKPAQEVSEYVTITPLLDTSEESYSVTDNELGINDINESNSAVGPFMIGAAVERKNSEDSEKVSRMAIFSSAYAFDEDYLSGLYSNIANPELIKNTVGWLCDLDDKNTISIPTKTDSVGYLTISDTSTATCIVILIIVLPLLILAGGFVIWIRRRRR